MNLSIKSFPDYEVENPGLPSQTVRITLTIAGRAIATRVVTSSTSTYYYLFTDHLGSTILMASQNSAKNQLESVTGSRATYYPFGDYRGRPPTQTLTDRGFTGQKSKNQPAADLGLLYYNARYYAPGLGRFISADTIVPDYTNPQSYNRYSYVANAPLRFADPTGHCGADRTEQPIYTPTGILMGYQVNNDKYEQCDSIRATLLDRYGWTLEGEWFLADVQILLEAGNALENWFQRGGALDPASMVKNVFGGTSFQYAGAFSLFRELRKHHVYNTTVVMLENFSLGKVIHELGHILDNAMSGSTILGGSAVWGGGISDQFANYVGMTDYNCILRFRCSGSYSGPGWDDNPDDDKMGIYWMNGAPEDFAQSFKFSVLDPTYLQQQSEKRYLFLNVLRASLIDTYEYHN